jgi:hypothetical protein
VLAPSWKLPRLLAMMGGCELPPPGGGGALGQEWATTM